MTTPSASVSKLAEANMRRWLERKKLDEKIAAEQDQPQLGPYLVISRQCGAGGEEIAAAVAHALGWELIDNEILDNIAKDYNVSRQWVEFVDEKHVAWLTGIFEAWIEGKRFNQEGYLQDLSKLLMIAAQHGKFVMIGRGAQFILPREFGLFVQIRAPKSVRINNVMAANDLALQEATELVSNTDIKREEFLRKHFQNDGADPTLYDLVIDTTRFDSSAVADLIETAIRRQKPTTV